jgi:predicted transcriptional regulator
LDAIDKKIIDYLTKRGGATTTELSKSLNLNRWKVWSRLVKIKERSREALGKPIVEFYAGEKGGKKRAWWLTTR